MENVREEIRAFMSAAEIILSPVLVRPPLSQQERDLVSFYAHNLIDYINTDRANGQTH